MRLYSEKGPNCFAQADTLPASSPVRQSFLAAINQLLREEIIRGIAAGEVHQESGGGQRLALCLNPDKLEEVRKELLIWYRDPGFIIPALIS